MAKDWGTGVEEAVNLTTMEILLFCALLSSTDVIAAISMISFDEQPKLYNLLFGEALTNDAISIILFNSINKFATKEMNAGTGFQILLDFILLGIFSLMIGALFGVMTALIMKKFRSFAQDASLECIILFSFGYLCYVTAEALHKSGIIALLTCGITMAHYTWYNLSPQGRQGTSLVFETISRAMEGFIFAYLGLTFFAYQEFMWSISLSACMVPIVIIGRFFSTVVLVKTLDTCCCYKSGIKTSEIWFMALSGMIRGAIAFGLVLKLDTDLSNRGLIVTTALTLVVFTTIFFGFFIGVASRCVTKEEPALTEDDDTNAISMDD